MDGGQADPVSDGAKESWRALADDAGFVAAYGIPLHNLPEVLNAVWALPVQETWTAVEFGPRTAAALVALRTAEAPGSAVPVPGLTRLGGRQRPVLDALNLFAAQRLDGHTSVGAEHVTQLNWSAGAPEVAVRT